MVRALGTTVISERAPPRGPDHIERALLLAPRFAARAALHDREASFPFENFKELSEAKLLALTVPATLGGGGAGARDAARILGILAKADPSTALVLSMHYIQHLVMARSTRWPGRLSRKLARESVEGVSLINALRVEPDPAQASAQAVQDFTAHGFKVVGKSDLLRRPDDARDLVSYKGPALGKTDRFVLVLRKV